MNEFLQTVGIVSLVVSGVCISIRLLIWINDINSTVYRLDGLLQRHRDLKDRVDVIEAMSISKGKKK